MSPATALMTLRGIVPDGSWLTSGRRAVAVTAVLAISGCTAGAASGPTSSSTASATVTRASTTPSATVATGPLLPGLIVFRRYDDPTGETGALFTIASDGTAEKQLTQPPATTLDDEPDSSPDGTRLVFTRSNAQAGQSQLFTMSSDGTGLRALTPTGSNGPNGLSAHDTAGVFSPDGTRIAFGTYRGHDVNNQIEFSNIGVMDANGSHRRQVTTYPAYSGDNDGVAWSPDGKHLVYAHANASTASPAGGRALFVIDVDGTHRRQLTPWELGAGGTPDWSAATNLIVFRAVEDDEAGKGNFYTIHPDGTGLTQVTQFTDTVISHKVGFSPDGKWIVFARDGLAGVNDVFIAQADGSALSSVTNTSQADSSPDWASR